MTSAAASSATSTSTRNGCATTCTASRATSRWTSVDAGGALRRESASARGVGEHDFDARSARSMPADLEAGPVPRGDFVRNRKSEAATIAAAARRPIERIEHPRAFAGIDAGSVVAHGDPRRIRADAHRHLAAFVAIANRVVDEIAHELAQKPRLTARHRSALGAFVAEIDVARD